MKKSKFRYFKDLYPQIAQLKNEGYQYKSIIENLKENHGLELSYRTFVNYLIRMKDQIELEDQNTSTQKTTSILNNSSNKTEDKPKQWNTLANTKNEKPIQNIDSTEQQARKKLTYEDLKNQLTEDEIWKEKLKAIKINQYEKSKRK